MQDTRTTPTAEPDRRTAVRRRAKRGFYAGYIHQLSVRHSSTQSASPPQRSSAPVREVTARV
jgi:hypothetical protein